MKRSVTGLILLTSLLSACSPITLSGEGRTKPNSTRPLELSDSERALGAFFRGEVAMSRGDFDTALGAFEEASRLDPEEPRLHARLAQLYLRQDEMPRALEEARFAVERQPEDIESRMLLAGILFALGDEQEAADQYRAVLEQDPQVVDAYLLLSSIYANWGQMGRAKAILELLIAAQADPSMGYYYLGRLLANAGLLDQAHDTLNEALQRQPRSVIIMTDIALVEEMRGRPEDANLLYRRVLSLDPGNEVARRRLAGMLVGQKKYDEALEEFRRLESIESDPSETRLKIGLIYFEKGDYESATAEFNLVRRARPGDPTVLYYLGVVHSETGEPERARALLEEIGEDEKLYVDARLQLVFIAQQEGDLAAALDYANQARAADPESGGIIELLIALQRERNQLPEAIELARDLIRENPTNDHYRFLLGTLEDDAGNRRAALDHMRKAIDLNPENAAALNYLGYSLAERGQSLEEAEALIRRALAVDPNDGFYIDSLGWVFYQRGQYEDAVEHLERAVELTGNDPIIHEHLADAYSEVGRELEALQLYRAAIAASSDTQQKRRIEAKVRAVERAGADREPSL
jgi:tetratricopeptide (TPR) repeat protein